MYFLLPSVWLGALLIFISPVFSIPYSEYILAPPSRTLYPVSVHKVNGTVTEAVSLAGGPGSATFQDASAVTFDFSKNIAGIVSIDVGEVSDANQYIGVTFTESSLWISGVGSDATTGADSGVDEPLWFHVTKSGAYTASKKHQRGGFRYLSLIHNSTGFVHVKGVSVYFTAVPHFPDDGLKAYTGYFHSDDEKLNRVWYAGAYTNQLCTIDPTAGNSLHYSAINFVPTSHILGTVLVPWYSNSTVSNGSSVLVDGAKRDRLVWPGDMIIAVPSIFVSTNDLVTVKNGLEALLILQNSSGALPYAGVPFDEFGIFSYTYHLYSLIGLYNYYMFSGDRAYLVKNWGRFKSGLEFILGKIDDSGLMNVTSHDDWLRYGMGGHNIEANSILYYTINLGLYLAKVVNDKTVSEAWQKHASSVKSNANALLWDPQAGLYRDNETTTLHPQDGNSWAVLSNLTAYASQIASISTNLAARWTPYGAPAVEADDAVSPFVSGFELQAHYLAGQPTRALDLIRLMWADFMLDDPRMTNSTFIEGYASDGRLHYAPYVNDPRVSHAHGWGTAPTSILSFYAAGIMATSAEGKTWVMKPSPGDLKTVEAGYKTGIGAFSAKYVARGWGWEYSFQAPVGTTGVLSVEHPGCGGILRIKEVHGACKGVSLKIKAKGTGGNDRIEVDGLAGGDWKATFAVLHDDFNAEL